MDIILLCPGCNSRLKEPFIRCAVCQPTFELCLTCFAKGFESGLHENSHNYEVIRYDFSVLESQWTASEEMQLLKAVVDCGIGNWSDVSICLKTKSPQECEKHYVKCYLVNKKYPEFYSSEPDFIDSIYPTPIVYKLCEDPPRPAPNSNVFHYMAGYMPARGDFVTEHENFAELEIKDLDMEENYSDLEEDDTLLYQELKFAQLDIYRFQLKERMRRKKIIRDYGLINIKKVLLSYWKYDKPMRTIMENLRPFTRLLSAHDFDMLSESLHYEYELKSQIKELQEFRKAGITHHTGAIIFKKLLARREGEKSKRRALSDILNHLKDESSCKHWLNKQTLFNLGKGLPNVLPSVPRRTAPPLDIVSLPGYEKLSLEEREICSTVRLVPDAFLEFKNILINECQKQGYLKLAQARTLIKIDVNKTRKIYDFLINQNLINMESR